MLRRNGVRISLSENMDAFHALEYLGIEDPALFRTALRATLVKQSVDIRTFEELFDLFFLGMGESIKESDRNLMAQMGLTPRQYQGLLEQLRDHLDRLDGEISPLARALLAGDMGQVERLLRQAAAAEGNLGQAADRMRITAYSRLAARLELGQVEMELEGFKTMVLGSGLKDEIREKISRYVDQRLQDLSRMIRDLIQQELKKSGALSSERERSNYLLQKSFAYYTEEDIRGMNEWSSGWRGASRTFFP